ncbi:MAG: hypothetical protein V7724_15890 [Sediminicola sp.]
MKRKEFIYIKMILVALLFSCQGNTDNPKVGKAEKWPPDLPSANEKDVAILKTNEFLEIPLGVQKILDAFPDASLTVAKTPPTIELTYFDELPNAALNGVGWSSWGDLCVAHDGTVYAGIGNHWGAEKGEAYIYSWENATKEIKKIADLNTVLGAKPEEVHFSKVHAHIVEGKDKKIYFTGTLDDGGLAGSSKMLEKWTGNIGGGKLFQYDPQTGSTTVYADFPEATVTATMKYDSINNRLYCALEGNPKGFAFGAFDMDKREWIYTGIPGQIANDRNFMLDADGNVYFNGYEGYEHTGVRLKALLREWEEDENERKGQISLSSKKSLGLDKRINKNADRYTTILKFDPKINKVVPTGSYMTSEGIRSSTRESKQGYIYGSTMGGELFRYAPKKDELELLGSNFLKEGEYITVCILSPDEKYLYYLPGAHGSAGFSGTPIIQYDIEKGQQKALAFLSNAMEEAFQYSPGGTFGLKISPDGSMLYIGLNGSRAGALKPEEHDGGFGLTSFAVVHIPIDERTVR